MENGAEKPIDVITEIVLRPRKRRRRSDHDGRNDYDDSSLTDDELLDTRTHGFAFASTAVNHFHEHTLYI